MVVWARVCLAHLAQGPTAAERLLAPIAELHVTLSLREWDLSSTPCRWLRLKRLFLHNVNCGFSAMHLAVHAGIRLLTLTQVNGWKSVNQHAHDGGGNRKVKYKGNNQGHVSKFCPYDTMNSGNFGST